MLSSDLNKVQVIGTVDSGAEIRYMPNGKAVWNMTVASKEQWKDNNGQTKERTEWHKTVTYGQIGEEVSKVLKEGSRVYIEGKLSTRKWKDNTGQNRYTTELILNQVIPLDSATSTQGDSQGYSQNPPAQGYNQQNGGYQQANSHQNNYSNDYDRNAGNNGSERDPDIPF